MRYVLLIVLLAIPASAAKPQILAADLLPECRAAQRVMRAISVSPKELTSYSYCVGYISGVMDSDVVILDKETTLREAVDLFVFYETRFSSATRGKSAASVLGFALISSGRAHQLE